MTACRSTCHLLFGVVVACRELCCRGMYMCMCMVVSGGCVGISKRESYVAVFGFLGFD